MTDDWRTRLIDTPDGIRSLLSGIHRVAILGARPDSMPDRPAYYVAGALQRMGLTILPVVVNDHPDAEILGEPVHRRLTDVPRPIDVVDVFRRAEDWRLLATKIDIRGGLYGERPAPSDEIWLRDSDVVVVPKAPVKRANDLIELYLSRGLYAAFPISFFYNFGAGSTVAATTAAGP